MNSEHIIEEYLQKANSEWFVSDFWYEESSFWDRNILCAYWPNQAAWILNIEFVYKAFANKLQI